MKCVQSPLFFLKGLPLRTAVSPELPNRPGGGRWAASASAGLAVVLEEGHGAEDT